MEPNVGRVLSGATFLLDGVGCKHNLSQFLSFKPLPFHEVREQVRR